MSATAIILKNSATASDRRMTFVLVDAIDLITPKDIAVSGVKVSLSFGGGSMVTSTNDIVKINGSVGLYSLDLTQAESNTGPCGVVGTLKPTGCARTYVWGQIAPATAYTASLSGTDIANAVVAAEKDALDGFLATGVEVELDGQTYDVTRDPTDKFLTSMSKQP